MQLTELASLIKSRRSIRLWQDKEVPEKLLLQAIELSTWAPNAGNQQNWYFYLIVNRDTIKAIADTVQASADLMASWPEAKNLGEEVARWRERVSFFRDVPAAIAVATTKYQSVADHVLAAREKTDPHAEQMRQSRGTANSQIQSVASAVAYLLLILHQMGLGALWMTGPMQVKGEIEKIIGIPLEKDLVAFIPVGYPAESPEPKERLPIAKVSEIIR